MAHFLLRQMSPFPILPQKKVILKTFRWKEKKEKPKGKKKKNPNFLIMDLFHRPQEKWHEMEQCFLLLLFPPSSWFTKYIHTVCFIKNSNNKTR